MFYFDFPGGVTVSIDPLANAANRAQCEHLTVDCLSRNGRLRIFRNGRHAKTYTLADVLRHTKTARENCHSQQATA